MRYKGILFITYQFKTGGVERVFCSLAELLDCPVYLITATGNHDSMVENIPSKVNRLSFFDNIFYKKLRVLQDYRYIRGPAKCFLLLCQMITFRFGSKYRGYEFVNFADTITTLLLAYAGGGKNTYSWLHYNPETIDKSIFAPLYKYVYRHMKGVICICKEQRDLFLSTVRGLKEENLHVVYNPLDYEKMRDLAKFNSPVDSPYFVMVARFDFRSKDFFTVINAYDLLPESIKSSYKLVFVGDGPDMPVAVSYVKEKKMCDNVIFAGLQKNPYMWIANAFAMVHSSKTEGLPTVLLEALACYTPVIATACKTGVREILNDGECGILVPVGNAKEMSDAMLYLVENPQFRAELIEKGSKHLKCFSPETISRKIQSLWKE